MSLQQKRFWLLLAYLAILVPFIAYGASRAMETNANSPIDWVPESFPARRDYDRFRAAFGSGDVVIISWPGCTVDEPKLDLLARVLREANAFSSDEGEWYFERVVTGREVLQTLTVAPTNLPREEALRRLQGTLVGSDGRTTCAVVTFTAEGLRERAKVVSLIRGTLSKYCKVGPDDWHLAGPVIDGLSVDEAGKRVLDKFAIPSAAIVLYVCWWDIGSVMTASVALGIAVDDTLHFLTFFRRGIDTGLNRRDAVGYAYRHCGTAMVQTTFACGLGLLIFAFGDFVPTSRFAWMMLALLTAALWGDLIVLPALLLGPLGKLFCSSASEPNESVLPQSPAPVRIRA